MPLPSLASLLFPQAQNTPQAQMGQGGQLPQGQLPPMPPGQLPNFQMPNFQLPNFQSLFQPLQAPTPVQPIQQPPPFVPAPEPVVPPPAAPAAPSYVSKPAGKQPGNFGNIQGVPDWYSALMWTG